MFANFILNFFWKQELHYFPNLQVVTKFLVETQSNHLQAINEVPN